MDYSEPKSAFPGPNTTEINNHDLTKLWTPTNSLDSSSVMHRSEGITYVSDRRDNERTKHGLTYLAKGKGPEM